MRSRHARPTLRGLLLAAVLSIAPLGGCAPRPVATSHPSASSAPVATRPAGTLLIVGGGPAPAEIPRRFVELAGGAGARIVVFPMASADSGTGPAKVAELRALGADAVSAPLTREAASSAEAARVLDRATGIWFSGGDQNRLTRVLAGTPVERAIHARYQAGAVVGGTSAGAAVMSARMITGDERRPGGDRPPRDSSDAWLTVARDNVVTAPGFGLLPGVVVDQHFLRRKRHNRLLSLVLELPERLAVGIDESTALEIGPDGRWRVLGASSAIVFDARQARIGGGSALGAADVRLHVLPAGATFDPATGRTALP